MVEGSRCVCLLLISQLLSIPSAPEDGVYHREPSEAIGNIEHLLGGNGELEANLHMLKEGA